MQRLKSKNGVLIVKFLASVSPRPRYSIINEHLFSIFHVDGIYDALLIYLDPNSYSTHDPVWETIVSSFFIQPESRHESLLKIELKWIKHKAIET